MTSSVTPRAAVNKYYLSLMICLGLSNVVSILKFRPVVPESRVGNNPPEGRVMKNTWADCGLVGALAGAFCSVCILPKTDWDRAVLNSMQWGRLTYQTLTTGRCHLSHTRMHCIEMILFARRKLDWWARLHSRACAMHKHVHNIMHVPTRKSLYCTFNDE